MNRQLLLRDNLSDTGTIPSPGCYYASPDLIVHSQVTDPQTFFKGNYTSDPSERLQTGAKVNFIYARVKNIGTSISQAFIRSYHCQSSLFLNPSVWRENQLSSLSGKGYVSTGFIQPGEIGVATEPFLFDAQASKTYCHTGYVMTSDAEPDFPEEFKDYDNYVAWIHGCTHAAARNHNIVSSQVSSYEQIDTLDNPSAIARAGLFKVSVPAGLAVGTRIIVNCEPMDIVNFEKVVTDSTKELLFTVSGIVPPKFSGAVRTAAYLPSGTTWPTGAVIRVDFMVEWTGNSVSAPYILDVSRDLVLAATNAGRLIHVGTCSTKFI